MDFPYNQYLRSGLYIPLATLVFVLGIAVFWIIKFLKTKERGLWAVVKGLVIPIIASILFLSGTLPTLRYTIFLLKEKPEESVQSIGEVERIEDAISSPRYYVPDEDKGIVRASIVRIDGNSYYFMTSNGLKIGDLIEVTYLPESRIVLSWDHSSFNYHE